jgi:hypothetical protein
MVKLQISTNSINSFGGLNFISNEFDSLGLPDLITEYLGERSKLASYEYHDIVKALWMVLFAGGDCAEDVQENLKSELSNIDNLKLSSADTILRLQKQLNNCKEIYLSDSGVENEISHNDNLNELNMAVLLRTKQLNPGEAYNLDFDNQFIACEKYDSKKGYKMKKGYFPGIATIGKNIVYLENRNGNSNVKFKQHDTLLNVYEMLNKNNIKVNKSRMDCGTFTKEVIKTVEANSSTLYIRARKCNDLTEQIRQANDWRKVMIGSKEVEVTSIKYKPFKEETEYRYVVTREANKNGQIDIFSGSNFLYRAIITNDWTTADENIVGFYNQRGASERIFDEMNNDFGWGNLPFSFLEENTVYMLLTAICRNFYLCILEKFRVNFHLLKTHSV